MPDVAAPKLRVAVPSDTSHADYRRYKISLLEGPEDVWARVATSPWGRLDSSDEAVAFEGVCPPLDVVWREPGGPFRRGRVSPDPVQRAAQNTYQVTNVFKAKGNALINSDQQLQAHVDNGKVKVHEDQDISTRNVMDISRRLNPNPPRHQAQEPGVYLAIDNPLVVGRLSSSALGKERGSDWPLGLAPSEFDPALTGCPPEKLSDLAYEATRQWIQRRALELKYDAKTGGLEATPVLDREPGCTREWSAAAGEIRIGYGRHAAVLKVQCHSTSVSGMSLDWYSAHEKREIAPATERYFLWFPNATPFLNNKLEAEGWCGKSVSWRMANGEFTVFDHRDVPAEILDDFHKAART